MVVFKDLWIQIPHLPKKYITIIKAGKWKYEKNQLNLIKT